MRDSQLPDEMTKIFSILFAVYGFISCAFLLTGAAEKFFHAEGVCAIRIAQVDMTIVTIIFFPTWGSAVWKPLIRNRIVTNIAWSILVLGGIATIAAMVMARLATSKDRGLLFDEVVFRLVFSLPSAFIALVMIAAPDNMFPKRLRAFWAHPANETYRWIRKRLIWKKSKLKTSARKNV